MIRAIFNSIKLFDFIYSENADPHPVAESTKSLEPTRTEPVKPAVEDSEHAEPIELAQIDGAQSPDTPEIPAIGTEADAGTEPSPRPDDTGGGEDPLAAASAALEVEGVETVDHETIARDAEHERQAERVRARAAELAAMSGLDYQVRRKGKAQTLGINLGTLDKAVQRERNLMSARRRQDSATDGAAADFRVTDQGVVRRYVDPDGNVEWRLFCHTPIEVVASSVDEHGVDWGRQLLLTVNRR